MIISLTVHAEPRFLTDASTYRVNFWDQVGPSDAWALDAQVLTDVASVQEALEWAIAEAGNRIFELFLELEPEAIQDFSAPRRSALVRLHGKNPNAP